MGVAGVGDDPRRPVGLLISRPVPWWLGPIVCLSIVAVFFAGAGPTGLVTTLIMAASFISAAWWPERRPATRSTGSVQLAQPA